MNLQFFVSNEHLHVKCPSSNHSINVAGLNVFIVIQTDRKLTNEFPLPEPKSKGVTLEISLVMGGASPHS